MGETISPFDELISSSEQCMKSRMEMTVMYFQAKVCKKIEEIEGGKKFLVDRWNRKEGGGGITCILQDGKITAYVSVFVPGQFTGRQVLKM